MIKLQKSTFFKEDETKKRLCEFITGAKKLSMGDECVKFEVSFTSKQKRKYAVFVNSGSSANLLLIQSLLNIGRLKKNDIVAVSPLTWATNIMPIIQLGLQPLLVDCEIRSLNVSSRTFKKALEIEPNIKCLFITNTLGFCDDISEINNLCEENGILFLEDNCEGLGSSVNGRLLGNFGFASTFSFFVGHHLSTIEGGMICTDDEELHYALVMSRSHGWDRNLPGEYQKNLRKKNNVSDFYSTYTFYDLAYNLRPTEISGFLGNIQINYWDEMINKRFNNFIFLSDAVRANQDIFPIDVGYMETVSSFAMPVILRDKQLLNFYIDKFNKNKIEIRPMIAGNIAEQPFFKKYVVNIKDRQPNAEFIHSHSFYFGNNPELTDKDLNLLKEILTNHP